MLNTFEVSTLKEFRSDSLTLTELLRNSVCDPRLYLKLSLFCNIFFFNCDSLHARLNSHYEAWSYKKKKHRKVKAYRKSV